MKRSTKRCWQPFTEIAAPEAFASQESTYRAAVVCVSLALPRAICACLRLSWNRTKLRAVYWVVR